MKQIIKRLPVLLIVILLAAGVYAGGLILHPAWASEEENTEALSDGTYTPTDFTFAGGSGRVTITCPSFTVEKGETFARIVFSSPHYEYVKVGEETFDPVTDAETSTFTIPVTLNEPQEIIGMTTAMSTPHEITYTIGVYYGVDPPADEAAADAEIETDTEVGSAASYTAGAPEIPGLTLQTTMDLTYATAFDVYEYSEGYRVLDVHDSAQYLLVPEGKEAPEGIGEDLVVLSAPVHQIYLAASAAMSLFDSLDAVDRIAFSGTEADDWTVDSARKAMADGDLIYAGKYSEPDYEMLVSGGCDLALESTMILHAPKVQEMIEDLGIPVIIDHSSYEDHPLGRTEWIKFYGALLDKEEAADAYFAQQEAVAADLEDFPHTQQTVAYFYISSDGTAVVRRADDYIPAMIKLAGGRYAFADLDEATGSSPTVKLTMEEFYAQAVEADYLIYDGTIDGQVKDLDTLIGKNELLADFAAVKNQQVWYTGQNFYQATANMGDMIADLNRMLTGGNADEMVFLSPLE